jgi:hypothetical protein
LGASLALEAAALGVPFLRNVLGTEKLGVRDVSIAFVLGTLPTILREGATFPWSQAPVVVQRSRNGLSEKNTVVTKKVEESEIGEGEPAPSDAWIASVLYEEAG